jgi:hypothetical protein
MSAINLPLLIWLLKRRELKNKQAEFVWYKVCFVAKSDERLPFYTKHLTRKGIL